ncbi:MAG TPA: transcriptional regulator [Planctomycetaceae bacterium]|nr:transcriptional regulator [Planctomycetaceae bacterium]
MYIPPAFREDRPEVLHAWIRAHPLGTLVTIGDQGLEANQIPWWLEVAETGKLRLLGHVARANPLGQSSATQPEVLVIFQGPSQYISPGWYPTKQEHGRVVPTWNYVVVHAHGRVVFHEDPSWIRAQLERLTDQMEANQPRPWSVGDAPPEYIAALLKSVVGVEILVNRLEGKWKVSQNQPEINRAGVIRALSKMPDSAAQEMARLVGEAARPE